MTSTAPAWLFPAVTGAAFLLCTLAEAARPLRRRVEARLPHLARNIATAVLALALSRPLQILLLLPLAAFVGERELGLLLAVEMPPLLELGLALLLLDYSLWFWHWANHRLPLLWRFHAAHHADADLDASTALRFHFGELALSVFYRALQVLVIGVRPEVLAAYATLLTSSTLFHHANLRLPLGLERILALVVVTPRMHGIHHSELRAETDSNYCSILSLWDRLHGTLCLNVPQAAIRIGLPDGRVPTGAGFVELQLAPFRRAAPDGRPAPSREAREEPAGRLLG